jgi:radical SAM protein with 4Fe4S-binding SPASM domain
VSDIASLPLTHGPRSKALLRRSATERIPIGGGFELTHRCNLACVHCYVNLPANDRGARQRELTTDEVYRVLDQLAEAGTLWLTLTGGEPLLRPDFCDIYAYAQTLGLVLTVYTNATLVTDAHIELWRAHPPRLIEVTQYGYSRETYDRVTDAGAQHWRFVRGIERMLEAGLPVGLKTVAIRDNKDEFSLMRDFAKRQGLSFRFDTVISPRIDGGKKPLAQRLTAAEIAAIEYDQDERRDDYADYCRTYDGKTFEDDRRYQCGAGLNTFLIDPYGKLHVCELSRRPGWDVLRDGLMAGIQAAFPEIRAEKRTEMSGCGTCPTSSTCSSCVGMAELEGHSPDFAADDAYFCQMTDARNEMFGGGAGRATPHGLVRLRLGRSNG